MSTNQSSASVAEQIAGRLRDDASQLRLQWQHSRPVLHFYCAELLQETHVQGLFASMPPVESLLLKRSLRESKRVGVSIDRYDPRVGNHLLAFQEPAVLSAIAAITDLASLEPDPSLYASGISVM